MTESLPIPLAYRRRQDCPVDPVPELLRLHSVERITRQLAPNGDAVWLIHRHADVRRVLSDRRFSTALTPRTVTRPYATDEAAIASPTRQPGSLPGMDPPEHTRLRRMVAPAFTARRMEALRPRIRQCVRECLDIIERTGPPTDLVKSFAQPVAALTICELLGVPEGDRGTFREQIATAFDRTLPRAQLASAFTAMWEYHSSLVAAKRQKPDDTVLGAVVRRYGAELSDAELTGLSNGFLLAGEHTSASMIGLGVFLLLHRPRDLSVMRDDPDAVPAMVEEILRYLSAAQTGLVRTATEDAEIGGQQIKAGEYVMLSLVAANRDPTVYENPNRFDITRDPENHLAFGHGPHFCIGAALARCELQIAFPELFRRLRKLRLAVPSEHIEFPSFSTIYGPESLPVTWQRGE
ncbi:cytochrome P450 [Streptomyces seoulensis]|uniref:cytochrome P450 n=1 Tax=Streptomyces seoulensis TaxID=73044 RepID=UPI003C2CA21A